MRTRLLIVLSVLVLVACQTKDGIPGSVIPQKKMQALLWDMMRADQFLADYVLNRDTSLKKETESLKYYEKIFALHKVSKDEFQHSFSFYRSRPALMKSIMDSISAPPKTATVLEPGEVNMPLARPDSSVQPAKPVPPKTALPKKRIDTLPRRKVKPGLAY